MESPPRYEDTEWPQRLQTIERAQKPPPSTFSHFPIFRKIDFSIALLGYHPTLFHLIFLALAIFFIVIFTKQGALVKAGIDIRDPSKCSFSTFSMAISGGTIAFSSFTTLFFYVNWSLCTMWHRGTNVYRADTLAIARKFFLLLVLGIYEVLLLIPKVSLLRDRRSHTFLYGILSAMLSLIVVNWACIKKLMECIQVWKHGKIVLIGSLAVAVCIIAIVPDNGEAKVEEDETVNGLLMGFYGAMMGLLFSFIGDWFLLHSPRKDELELIELQNMANARPAANATAVRRSQRPTTAREVV